MKFSQKSQKLILERDSFDSLELVENQKLIKAIEAFSESNKQELSELNLSLSELLTQEKTFFGLVSWDTVITALITILVFFLGYLANHFYNKYLARGEAGFIRTNFSDWIDLHSDRIKKQIESLDNFSKKLKGSKELQEEQLAVSSLQLKKLLELPNLKLMNVFVVNSTGDKNENSKAYFNLISSLEFLSSFNDRLFEKYQEFTNGTDHLRNEWNKNFREFDELRVSFVRTHARKDAREGEFARQVGKFSAQIFLDKTPEGSSQPIINLEEWVNEFFVPLRVMTNKEMSENLEFLDVQILASKIEDLLIVHKRWIAWKEGFSSIFDDFQMRLKESFENVEKQIGYFNKNGLVGFFQFRLFR